MYALLNLLAVQDMYGNLIKQCIGMPLFCNKNSYCVEFAEVL